MRKCLKLITKDGQEIYTKPELYGNLLEYIRITKATLIKGFTNSRIHLKGLKAAIDVINDKLYKNPQIQFVEDESLQNDSLQVNSKNYLEYIDQALEAQNQIAKILISGKKSSLTQIINKLRPQIKLSRNAWTNHFNKVLEQLKSQGKYEITKQNRQYIISKKKKQ